MAVQLTWLGHACWLVETGGYRLVIDPFLDDSPTAPVKSDQVEADYVLVTHGHYDHVADAGKIAQRTGATVVANFEICEWLAKRGAGQTEPMNLGGGISLPFGRVAMTIAHHSSTLPDGSSGGNPGGFVLALPEMNLYVAGDTALFDDMRRIGQSRYGGRQGIDLAILPIGDRYTMGPDEAVEAARLLEAKQVAPCHYNTWPPIAQDAKKWAEEIRRQTKAEPHVPEPGGIIQL